MTDFPAPQLIELGDVTLEVYQAGEGGIPLVLCHGWPEIAFSWRHQVQPLVEAGFHCIMPNQRGYGRSSRPDDVQAYDIHHLTSDHAALLDALGIDCAIYVGHDWGAMVVWQLALLQPERVAALANLSVPFLPRSQSEPVALWEQSLGPDHHFVHFNRQPGVAARSFERHTRRFLTNLYRTGQWLDTSEDTPRIPVTRLADVEVTSGQLLMSATELDVFVQAFEYSGFIHACNWYRNLTRNWETTADVEQKVRQPSLMIFGEYDTAPNADMTHFVDDLEVHTLPCGHWIQQEAPAETNRILLEWLDQKARRQFS